MATNDAELIVRCHWMLLRLAGSTPDDLLATWRWWLGEGRVTEVGRSVSDTVPAQRLSLTRPDLDLLADLVSASAADGSVLAAAEVAEPHLMPECTCWRPIRTPTFPVPRWQHRTGWLRSANPILRSRYTRCAASRPAT